MILIDFYFQLFSVSIFILMLLVLIYYLTQINKLNNEIKNSENVIQRIIIELRQRLSNQDQKLLDLDVKLNIVELRLSKYTNQSTNKIFTRNENNISYKPRNKVMSQPQSISQGKIIFTNTEKEILNSLSYKDCTANELQISLKKSREHTSRLLNKLFHGGHILRDNSKKPYIYKLSNINETTLG